jgi:hypothetical protein
MSERVKNPVFVESGRRGMRARWGEQRHLRLTDLDPATRRAILAIVAAARDSEARRDDEAAP